MITKSENMKKLRNRNIFEEIKKSVTPIQDTTQKDKQVSEQEHRTEYDKIIEDVFGDE